MTEPETDVVIDDCGDVFAEVADIEAEREPDEPVPYNPAAWLAA